MQQVRSCYFQLNWMRISFYEPTHTSRHAYKTDTLAVKSNCVLLILWNIWIYGSAHKSHWSVSLVCCPESLDCHWHFPHNWELQLGIVHLLHMFASALTSRENGSVDYLDGARLGTVAACHLRVHLADGTIDGNVTVFLVHVVRVGTALIPEPHSVVLYLCGSSVIKLIDSKQFTATFLCLVDLLHEVPESALGQNCIPSEKTHPINFWGWIFWGWSCTTNNLVLVHPCLEGWINTELSHCSISGVFGAQTLSWDCYKPW